MATDLEAEDVAASETASRRHFYARVLRCMHRRRSLYYVCLRAESWELSRRFHL